jgi:endonuclease/exonuclease/phosphatase family metal-dependent hydrolase
MRDILGYHHIAYGLAADLYWNGFYGQVTVSKLPFITEPFTLSLHDSNRGEGRAALLTQLDNGLTIINLHLDVWDRSGGVRTSQLQQVKSLINNTLLPSPVILCGDFNTVRRCDYSAAEWSELCSIQEIETVSMDVVSGMGGRDVFDVMDVRMSRSHVHDPKRVDYIFIIDKSIEKKKLIVKEAKRYDVLYSDHFPLSAVIELHR